MLNDITLMGRLTRDPELRYTQNQTPVCSFTLACDRDIGSKKEDAKTTDFIDCVAWRHTAEFISKHFTKGRMMVVHGRLQTRDYEDREGNKHKVTEIPVENAYFGDSRKAETRSGTPEYIQPGNEFQELSDDEGELPF
jgi:single-strand DNA-binding protein